MNYKVKEPEIKIGTLIAFSSVIVLILVAVSGFTYDQNKTITRNDERIKTLEKSYVELKEMRKDISKIKESLVRLATILEREYKKQ